MLLLVVCLGRGRGSKLAPTPHASAFPNPGVLYHRKDSDQLRVLGEKRNLGRQVRHPKVIQVQGYQSVTQFSSFLRQDPYPNTTWCCGVTKKLRTLCLPTPLLIVLRNLIHGKLIEHLCLILTKRGVRKPGVYSDLISIHATNIFHPPTMGLATCPVPAQ